MRFLDAPLGRCAARLGRALVQTFQATLGGGSQGDQVFPAPPIFHVARGEGPLLHPPLHCLFMEPTPRALPSGHPQSGAHKQAPGNHGVLPPANTVLSACFSGVKFNIRLQQPRDVSPDKSPHGLPGESWRGPGGKFGAHLKPILGKKNVSGPSREPWEQSPGLWAMNFPFPLDGRCGVC